MEVEKLKSKWYGEVDQLDNNLIDQFAYKNPILIDVNDKNSVQQSDLNEEGLGLLKYAEQLKMPVCVVNRYMHLHVYNTIFSQVIADVSAESNSVHIFDFFQACGYIISEDLSSPTSQLVADYEGKTLIMKGKQTSWKIKISTGKSLSDPSLNYLLLVFQELEIIASDKLMESENFALKQDIMELKNFSYLLAHDLKSPLRIIQAFSELLMDDVEALPSESSRIISIIRQKSSQAKSLVDDLLSLFNLKTRKLKFEEVDLNPMIDEIIADLPVRSNLPCIAVSKPLPIINGIKSLLYQLLANLISNAFKFTSDEQYPTITIAWESLDNGIKLNVRDNGIGLDMQHKDEIFNPFFRLNVGDNYRGNGLGLSMVKKIVEFHQGEISVDSVPGEFTAFTITLPTIKTNLK